MKEARVFGPFFKCSPFLEENWLELRNCKQTISTHLILSRYTQSWNTAAITENNIIELTKNGNSGKKQIL
jgi:hypothetical protein